MNVVKRALFLVFLLGSWVQAASACPESALAPAMLQGAMEIIVSPVGEVTPTIGGEHRCECPAMMQHVQSVVSESGKSQITSYIEGASAFMNSSNPGSVALAVHTRASSFIARHPGQPPYLLAFRLRQ